MKPGVPPETFTIATPLLAPLQTTLDCTEAVAVPPVVLPTTARAVVVQPLASLTVTVYVAAINPEMVCPAALLLQLYVRAPVPPAAITLACPLG